MELTKSAKKSLAILYKEYCQRVKSGISKQSAISFIKGEYPDFLLDDVKDADTDEYHTINNAPQPQQTVQSTQEPLTREQKISKICAEVLMCNSTDELSTLWKKLKRWTDEEQIKNTFSQRKNELLKKC